MKLSAVLVLALVAAAAALPATEISTSPGGRVLFRFLAATDDSAVNHFQLTGTLPPTGELALTLVDAADPFACTETPVDVDATYSAVLHNGKHYWHLCAEAGTASNDAFEISFITCETDQCNEPSAVQTHDIYVYAPCEGEDGGVFGDAKATPTAPIVALTYDGDDEDDGEDRKLHISVETPYIRNGLVFLDFFKFESDAEFSAVTDGSFTCSSYRDGLCTSADCFSTFPNADFEGFDDKTPFNLDGDSVWGVTGEACGKLEWSASFSFADLESCEDGDKSPFTINQDGGITYSGTLFVSYLRPVDPSAPTGGFHVITHEYPFELEIVHTVEAFTHASNKYHFDVEVTSLKADADAGLTLVLLTSIKDNDDLANSPELENPTAKKGETTFDTEEEGISLIIDDENTECETEDSNPCVQTTTLTLPTVPGDGDDDPDIGQFAGDYEFTWEIAGVSGETVKALLTINVGIGGITATFEGIEFDSNLVVVLDGTGWETASATPTFVSGDDLILRHSLVVQSGDEDAIELEIQEVSVCWSDFPDFVPTSCFEAPSIVTSFAPDLDEDFDTDALPASAHAVRFPIAHSELPENGDTTFYFHVRSEISFPGGATRRSVVRDDIYSKNGKLMSRQESQASQMTSARMLVRKHADAESQPSVASSSVTSFAMGAGVSFALAAVVYGAVSLRRRKYEVIPVTEETELESA